MQTCRTVRGVGEGRRAQQVWAVDFQFDATTDGRTIKIVSIVDEHTRECLGGLVERSVTADVLIKKRTASPASVATRHGPKGAARYNGNV